MTFEINSSFDGRVAIASTSARATTLPSTTPALNVKMSGLAFVNFDIAFDKPTGSPVGLSKAISKFTKANPDIFTFKAGVVEGKVVALADVEAIATLPSKEELISKVMFLINCQAQRLATVISAVPRNLAVVIKQVSEQKTA